MNFQRLWIRFTTTAVLIGIAAAARADEGSKGSDEPSAKPESVASPSDPLAAQVEQAIQATSLRRLTAGVHTPWQVVHGILAQRWELSLLKKEHPGEELNAIEWITSGVTFDGEPLWEATPYGGRGHPFTRPYAFEGHPTQFMGYMTMANIPLEYEVKTPTKVITIGDIIKDAKMQIHQGVEITWTLWALAHYEEPDAQWFNAAGEPWSIERLVRMQIDEPVTTGACGGCHGLFALAYARNMYISTGKPLRGVWFEADQKIKRYILEAQILQNADGSFSANHFNGPGYSEDFATRIATSGHQLEWLMIALPQSKLKEEWVRKGVANIARDLMKHRYDPSDCGPLFHGMHALVVYRQRTVPGHLIPKFNSHVKLAERGKKKLVPERSAKSVSDDKPAPSKISRGDSQKVIPAGQQLKARGAENGASSSELDPAKK
ncbi:MAG TPA: hypothetical protein VKU82_16745 [Planctomycetaceae bacterium]|nr:hypothetical protein [Planctomycetaceae bacterium]